jgi:hypothetical protein
MALPYRAGEAFSAIFLLFSNCEPLYDQRLRLSDRSVLWVDAVEGAGEGDGFADVVEAADPGDGALDAHAEAGVGDGAVLA